MGAESSGALIEAGAKFAAEAVFGKSARKAAKGAARAQERLFLLQAEEQEIRNRRLKADLEEMDRTLPVDLVNPGLGPDGYGTRIRPEGMGAPKADAPLLAGANLWIVLGLGAAVVVMFFMRR